MRPGQQFYQSKQGLGIPEVDEESGLVGEPSFCDNIWDLLVIVSGQRRRSTAFQRQLLMSLVVRLEAARSWRGRIYAANGPSSRKGRGDVASWASDVQSHFCGGSQAPAAARGGTRGSFFLFLRKLGSRRISGTYHRGSVQVLQGVPSETTIVFFLKRSHMLRQLCSRAEWKVHGGGALGHVANESGKARGGQQCTGGNNIHGWFNLAVSRYG